MNDPTAFLRDLADHIGATFSLRAWADRIASLFDVGGDWWSDEEEGS